LFVCLDPPSILAWIAEDVVYKSNLHLQDENKNIHSTPFDTPQKIHLPISPQPTTSTHLPLPISSNLHLLNNVPTYTYYIDRNPQHFQFILDYLRDKKVVLPEDENTLREIGLESQVWTNI
jgi:hypothetical protein